MERPNKGLSLAAMNLSLSGLAGVTSAMARVLRFELGQQDAPLSAGHRIGPGRRTADAVHKRIADEGARGTEGAQRMRDLIALRRSNWERGK
jgi:hypothetical protein